MGHMCRPVTRARVREDCSSDGGPRQVWSIRYRRRSSIRVPLSIKQTTQITTKSFADVREVSADLEATHPSCAACRMSGGIQPSTGILPATLTSIANVCALRSDISGHMAVGVEHLTPVRSDAPHIADRPTSRELDT